MSIEIDETMSQEPAFTTDNNAKDEGIKFAEDKVEKVEVTENTSKEESDPASQGGKNKSDVSDPTDKESEEDNRIPYSRFKRKEEELEERDSIIKSLEERLSSLETAREESKPLEELEVPKEWVELYGDSDVSKRAYKIQLQREEQLQENAVIKAIKRIKEESKQEEQQQEENESIIEDNLSSLRKTFGNKISKAVEEEVLTIVDEFSPTGKDGKYVSLFPFDKAYEIYELRNSKASVKTKQAREKVADLTGGNSEGEPTSSGSDFKRGWDNWREEL